MTSEEFKNWKLNLPELPGIYRFYNTSGKLLYVGKAKNLRKRVANYFLKEKKESARLRLLALQTQKIEFTIVENETDALLLENNFIKRHQPKYNIRLKDDKTYPYICIKNEPFPRVFTTRKKTIVGSTYFGPYTNAKLMFTLLELIKKTYPLRTCNLPMKEHEIKLGKYKSCLEYQIGNCLAPCEAKQTQEEYNQQITEIKKIISGELSDVLFNLKEKMLQQAALYEFEKAEKTKLRKEILSNYQAKSTIVSQNLTNLEVYSIAIGQKKAIVNCLTIKNGAIIQSYNLIIEHQAEETKEELLVSGIIDIRQKFNSQNNKIILPFLLNENLENIEVVVPKIGEKLKLLELSFKNATYLLKTEETTKTESEKKFEIVNLIKKDLNLNELPIHIECFDNSNLQGTNPVSAVVVFKNGKPTKSEYRIFNIKTVEGPNDFATMEEALTRRYKRLVSEEKELPQLVLIDGGKGQLSSAYAALTKINLHNKIQLIGIAKRLEELYFPNDPVPIHLNKKSITIKILQQLRDEAHRFSLKNHRNRRSKNTIKSIIDNVPGIGPKLKIKLFEKFGSLQNIQNQTIEEISKIIGPKKAETLLLYINKKGPK